MHPIPRPLHPHLPAAALLVLFAGCSSSRNDPPAVTGPPAAAGAAAAPGAEPGADGEAAAGPADHVPGTGPAGPATPGPGRPATPGPVGPATGGRGGDQFFLGATRWGAHTEDARESYAEVSELGFVATDAQALSTFAAEVDTASFGNARRFLRAGHLPPAASVRVEEFVNAQAYRDPGPAGREPFAITTEVGPCPWQPRHELLRIGLRTRAIDAARVPPCNLVFLIDVSGSMSSADKLPLVRRAMALLVDQLRPQDRVSIVTYAAGVKVALRATTGASRGEIHAVLADLQASGSTDGAGGIQRAYETALSNLVPEGVNRVILATDGDFNVGIREPDELERFIAERRDLGVFLTVLGVGGGNLRDDRLERLADRGNGVYAYLDSLHEARRVLVEQFGASMMTVAKDVKLQIEFDPARVAGYRQIGYENRQLAARDFRDDSKDAGELGAGHALTALYEIVPAGMPVPGRAAVAAEGAAEGPAEGPAGDPAEDAATAQLAAQASFRSPARDGAIATLRLRYKPPLADAARELARPVAAAGAAASPSRDFRVAAAAAAFGMILRGSAHLGGFGYDELAALIDDPALDAAELACAVARARQLHAQR